MTSGGLNFIRRALLVWLVLMSMEFVHGMIRAIFLVPHVGDSRSRQTGVFTGSVLILIVAYMFVRWIDAPNTKALIAVRRV